MKLIKNTLFIIALFAMAPVSAKSVGGRSTATSAATPTAPAGISGTPARMPQKSFQSYLIEVRTKWRPADVINAQGMFTDKFENFVKSSGLAREFQKALLEAGAHLHGQFTGTDRDNETLNMINGNVIRVTLANNANYQQFMKSFRQTPVLPTGAVSPAWIEGAALALRADGLNTMNDITSAMKDIITNFVMSSPVAHVRSNLPTTLQSFEDNWQAIQKKGIGAPTVSPQPTSAIAPQPTSAATVTNNFYDERTHLLNRNWLEIEIMFLLENKATPAQIRQFKTTYINKVENEWKKRGFQDTKTRRVGLSQQIDNTLSRLQNPPVSSKTIGERSIKFASEDKNKALTQAKRIVLAHLDSYSSFVKNPSDDTGKEKVQLLINAIHEVHPKLTQEEVSDVMWNAIYSYPQLDNRHPDLRTVLDTMVENSWENPVEIID